MQLPRSPFKTAGSFLSLSLALGLSLLPGTAALAAALPAKVTLTCTFPAAEAPNRIQPQAKNVSDGVIRINPETWTLKICQGCAWENSGAKWEVSPSSFRARAPSGIEILISRADGSARLTVSAAADEYYQGGKAESAGQCKRSGT